MWRTLAALMIVVGLGACAPTLAPPGPGPTEAKFTDSAFITSDGLSLPLRRWLPDESPKAVVLALHGFNDYAKAFDKIPDGATGTGPFLAWQGYAVYAYDQRGFGGAPNAGLWPGTDALVADARDAVAVLRRLHPGLPVYGLGESMGGAVWMAAVAEAQTTTVDGLILAAPAVWARSTMPFFYRAGLWLGARLMPGLKPTGRGLGIQASDNIELLRHNARDPLFIKKTRLDAIAGITDLMDGALAAASKIDVPTLYLYGRNDQVIPKAPTLKALRAMTEAGRPVQAAYYDDGWHIILRDKQAQTVLKDVAAFMAASETPLPSKADDNGLARLQSAAARPRAGQLSSSRQ
jgi:alpha-beta hydrolase superfamily lysophospholipase